MIEVRKVGVVGCGLRRGPALRPSGLSPAVWEPTPELLEKGLSRILGTTELPDLAHCDLVVEEDLTLGRWLMLVKGWKS